MPEMLTPTSAIMGAGLGKECALITDGEARGQIYAMALGGVQVTGCAAHQSFWPALCHGRM